MTRSKSPTQTSQNSRPFLTPEGQTNHIISLANNLLEQRLRDGTASSQEVCTALKLGSPKERLELEKLEEENKLLKAKTEALKSQKRVEELYSEALTAMRRYAGQGQDMGDEDDEY